MAVQLAEGFFHVPNRLGPHATVDSLFDRLGSKDVESIPRPLVLSFTQKRRPTEAALVLKHANVSRPILDCDHINVLRQALAQKQLRSLAVAVLERLQILQHDIKGLA